MRSLQTLSTLFRTQPAFRGLVARSFRLLQRVGLNVTPTHYYQPIPDLNELKQRDWSAVSQVPGLDLRLDQQLHFLRTVVPRYRQELHFPAANGDATRFHLNNGWFEAVDAEVLYCMIREHRPRRIVEIGSGYSTRLMLEAIRRNRMEDGLQAELVSINPFPDPVIRKGLPGVTLVQKPVETIEPKFFESLGARDILFIDSSHVVRVGNDVVFEYLEVLPRLRPGVLIHVHDIFLPADYPREWVVGSYRFWSEQYLLQAFLCFNHAFRVLWAGSAMQLYHGDALEQAFPNWSGSLAKIPAEYKICIPSLDGCRVWPTSFWMEKVQ